MAHLDGQLTKLRVSSLLQRCWWLKGCVSTFWIKQSKIDWVAEPGYLRFSQRCWRFESYGTFHWV